MGDENHCGSLAPLALVGIFHDFPRHFPAQTSQLNFQAQLTQLNFQAKFSPNISQLNISQANPPN
jgi:hypothetical protein